MEAKNPKPESVPDTHPSETCGSPKGLPSVPSQMEILDNYHYRKRIRDAGTRVAVFCIYGFVALVGF